MEADDLLSAGFGALGAGVERSVEQLQVIRTMGSACFLLWYQQIDRANMGDG
jgi:hypothetical protein